MAQAGTAVATPGSAAPGAEVVAQRVQSFDRFAVPVKVNCPKVVLVHAQVDLIVKPVGQGAA